MGRYLEYLRSDDWKAVKAAVIQRCSNICEVCGVQPVDDIHHKTYERLYAETLDDLLGVCTYCHEKLHGLRAEGGEIVAEELRAISGSDQLKQRLEHELELFLDPNRVWKYWKPSPTAEIQELESELTPDRQFLYGHWDCKIVDSTISGDDLSVRLRFFAGGKEKEIRLHNLAQRFRSGELKLDGERKLFLDFGSLTDGLRILAAKLSEAPRTQPGPKNPGPADVALALPEGDLEKEVTKLVHAIYALSKRSKFGWTNWTEVASLLNRSDQHVDFLAACADLPEWKPLFTVGRGGLVRLSPQGIQVACPPNALHAAATRQFVDPAERLHEPPKESSPLTSPREFTNSLGMRFAWMPSSTFVMGSPEGEFGRDANEETPHRVTVTRGLYVGVFPVTQAQWKAVMGKLPSQFKGDNLPVEKVSWHDCNDFCKKLSRSDGRTYRLLTEAEWECACRAGTATAFYFGNTLSADQANFRHPEALGAGIDRSPEKHTTPVGQFAPNAWGLYDMHGNVWEWCSDRHGPYPRNDVWDYQGAACGDSRVLRGGAWNFPSKRCRSASRHQAQPQSRWNNVGFRIGCVVG